jgi:hypothetical protein
MIGLSRVTHLLITKHYLMHFVIFKNKQPINMSSPDINNDNTDNPPGIAVHDDSDNLFLLYDTSTDEKGDDDNNNNTGGDNVDAHQRKSDSADIGLELGSGARAVLEDSYLVKWDEVHADTGTSIGLG